MDLQELKEMITGKLIENEPMKNHTSYGIGGPAVAFIEPKSVKDLQLVKSFVINHQVSIYCIGGGSNLLVSDDGIDGIVVSLEKSFKKILFDKNTCYAEAGIKLSKLVKECVKNNFIGLETLIGIPGTLGGALIMNAGAFGNERSSFSNSISERPSSRSAESVSSSQLSLSDSQSFLPLILPRRLGFPQAPAA